MKNKYIRLFIFLIILLCLLSLGFSSFDTMLNIAGSAIIRLDKDLKIYGVSINNSVESSEVSQATYTSDSVNFNVNLVNSSSVMKYEITIFNRSGDYFTPGNFEVVNYSNSNVSYNIENLVEYGVYESKYYVFYITFKTTGTNQTCNLNLKFDLEKVNETSWDFHYIENYQLFDVSYNSKYRIELWGAGGTGGGSYTAGDINLTDNVNLYVYVGGMGADTNGNTIGGWNGGGNSTATDKGVSGSAGSGATDIRIFSSSPSESDLEWDSDLGLRSRIMVAAAGTGDYIVGGGIEGY